MKLFIGNLTYETTEEELREVLAEHEPILNIHRPTDRETGKPRGFAFVTFSTREDGENAMEALNGKKLNGREMKVNEAEERRSFDRPEVRRVTMDVEITRAVDDRPVDSNGERIRYKGI